MVVCSDIDVLSYYLSGLKPSKVQSFGSVGHFKPSKKPAQAGDAKRCHDCAYASECVWEAKKIYVDPLSQVEDSQRVSPTEQLRPRLPALPCYAAAQRHLMANASTCSGLSTSSMPMCSISKMSARHSRPARTADACTSAVTTWWITKW